MPDKHGGQTWWYKRPSYWCPRRFSPKEGFLFFFKDPPNCKCTKILNFLKLINSKLRLTNTMYNIIYYILRSSSKSYFNIQCWGCGPGPACQCWGCRPDPAYQSNKAVAKQFIPYSVMLPYGLASWAYISFLSPLTANTGCYVQYKHSTA